MIISKQEFMDSAKEMGVDVSDITRIGWRTIYAFAPDGKLFAQSAMPTITLYERPIGGKIRWEELLKDIALVECQGVNPKCSACDKCKFSE